MTVAFVRHARFRRVIVKCRNTLAMAAFPALLATIGGISLISPGVALAQVAAPVATTFDPAPAGIEDVVNVIGFDQFRRGGDGRLAFDNGNLVLVSDKATGTIPLDTIRSFTIERSTTALMRGTEGQVVGFIPRGVGNLYHAIRRGAHTLTIYYVDKDEALHGAVLILPKSRKDDVLNGFAGAGLSPSPMSASPMSARPVSISPAIPPRSVVADTSLPGARPSVSIMLPELNGQALPAAYQAAIYEQLNTELAESGMFATVWRHGDARVPADALTLSVHVNGFSKGNPGLRGGLPVFGMLVGKTLIKADMILTTPSGTVLLHKAVKGSKRMSGESIAAAKSLAQRISASIKKAPGFARDKQDEKQETQVAVR